MCTSLALSIVSAANSGSDDAQDVIDAGQQKTHLKLQVLSSNELDQYFTAHDLKRLDAYSRNLVDFHMVTDLLPQLAILFLQHRLPQALSLSLLQRALLLGMGIQQKVVEELSAELNLPTTQLLALFNKSVRKLSSVLNKLQEDQVAKDVDNSMQGALKLKGQIRGKELLVPLNKSMDAEQQKSGELKHLEYAVQGDEAQWNTISDIKSGQVVSIKRKEIKKQHHEESTPKKKSKQEFNRSTSKKHKRK